MNKFIKIKCKYENDSKKCKTCRIKNKYYDCFLDYTDFKDDLMECKCLSCNNNYQQKFGGKLKQRFSST